MDAVTAPARAAKSSAKAKTQFPPPPFNFSQDRNGRQNAWKFFEYWQKLTETQAAVAEVRVYRCWPVVNAFLGGEDVENKVFEVFYGPCPFTDPRGYAEYFINRFNAGDWKLILQEVGVSGKIMSAFFPARSLENPTVEDFQNWPPQVDIRTLTRHKDNESYIRWLKRNNQPLPWEISDEDEFFMASPQQQQQQQPTPAPVTQTSPAAVMGEAFKVMADSHVTLARQAVESAEKNAEYRERQAEARLHGPDPTSVGYQESIKLVTATADKMISMVTNNAGRAYDPIAILKAAKELRDEPKPAGDSGNMMESVLKIVQASNDRVLNVYEKQAQTMEKMLTLKSNGDGSHGPAITPAKSFVEQAAEYKQIAELFGWSRTGLVRSESAAPPPAAPDKPSWFNETTAPIIIMGFQTVMVLTANIVHNWAATKISGMKPQAPGEAVQQMASAMAQQNGQDPDAAGPGAPGAGAQGPTAAERRNEMLRQFAIDFEQPFLGHYFVADPKGYTLAHFMMSEGTMAEVTPGGRQNYVNLKTLGRDTLERVNEFKKLLAGNVSLWSKIQGDRRKLDQFITEFFTFDEWAQQQRENAQRMNAQEATTV
ncbi:MAG: hypothetical protein IVW54_16585 [Candidatus Binataceae bacterium]|nr:hypothetical protein [Candidatus Binataceae bacterium]